MKVNNGLTNLVVLSLALNSNGHIFAGTQRGVFRSTNNGDTWVNTGLMMPNEAYSLALDSNGHIFVGTYSGRVFRSVESTTK